MLYRDLASYKISRANEVPLNSFSDKGDNGREKKDSYKGRGALSILKYIIKSNQKVR